MILSITLSLRPMIGRRERVIEREGVGVVGRRVDMREKLRSVLFCQHNNNGKSELIISTCTAIQLVAKAEGGYSVTRWLLLLFEMC